MPPQPVTVKLRISSWEQLEAIHHRDLRRSALFLKSRNRPPLGMPICINLTLPSGTLVILNGTISAHVPPGGLGGRGPGVDIKLESIPPSTMWLIESALSSMRRERSRRAGETARSGAPPGPDSRPRASSSPDAAPSMEDGARFVEAEGGLVQALAQELAGLKRLNAFQVLDIPYECDDAEVRAAFAELTKRYHPDRFARYQSGEARKHASEIFILIRDAYRRLADPASRQRERNRLRGRERGARDGGAGRTGAPTRVVTPRSRAAAPPPARAAPRRSEAGLSEGVARPATPEAAHAHGAEGIESGPLGDAEALLDTGDYDKALSIYRLAARRDRNDRRARAGLELAEGLKALADGDRLEAAQRFEAVLEMEPDNERAARALTEIRRRATNERKGFLTRLLGKKEGS